MREAELIRGAVLVTAVAFAVCAAVHIAASAAGRRASAAAFALLVLGGPLAVWHALGRWPSEVGGDVASLRAGSLGLYLAGVVAYAELRSLLSRGYSLRILLDLLDLDEGSNLEQVKSSYGRGMGLVGMLAKRLGTLQVLGLVRGEGASVGPLTLLGRCCAAIAMGIRRLLRLDVVG